MTAPGVPQTTNTGAWNVVPSGMLNIGLATVRFSGTVAILRYDGVVGPPGMPRPSTPKRLLPHARMVPPVLAFPTKTKLERPPAAVAKTSVRPGTRTGDACGERSA